jgi:hypothetical protein
MKIDKKEQTRVTREQIDKNVKIMRWRLGRADSDVIQQLVCCLSRSMLIYLGTPWWQLAYGSDKMWIGLRPVCIAKCWE